MGSENLFTIPIVSLEEQVQNTTDKNTKKNKKAKKKKRKGVAITLTENLLSLNKGDELNFTSLSGNSYTVVFDRLKKTHKRSLNWVGHLKNSGVQYRVLISIKGKSVRGRINTPEGPMKLKTIGGELRLIDYKHENYKPVPFVNDVVVPEELPVSQQADIQSLESQSLQDSPGVQIAAAPTLINGNSIVDVLVVYNNLFATENAGDVLTRIDHLISLTNQAYLDSKVAMQIRLVGTKKVNYTNQSSNSTALGAITNNTISGVDIAALRNQVGADLVVIIRPFDKATHASCGTAWLNRNLNSAYGYGAVSDGSDIGGTNYYCSDTTFAHELGHNMGLTHDYANAGGSTGSHSYSYGYGVSGIFGSIMSYLSPSVEVFSNPDISICNGRTCGTAAYDAVRSLSLDKQSISNFRNEVINVTDSDGDGYDDEDDTFPNDPTEWVDTDRDGIGNNADLDDDNDNMSDFDEIATGRNPLVNEGFIVIMIQDN